MRIDVKHPIRHCGEGRNPVDATLVTGQRRRLDPGLRRDDENDGNDGNEGNDECYGYFIGARRLLLAFAAAGLAAFGLPTQAQTVQPAIAKPADAYSAQVATEWFQLGLLLAQQTPGFSPPVAARAFGYL